jgi:riboflavin synthase
MPETLLVTTISEVARRGRVNLELPARLADRIGGHLVQGHVDGVAEVVRVDDEAGSRRIWFAAQPGLTRYVIVKGSVAVDGVSLTVVGVGPTTFEVALTAHTLEVTTLGDLGVGSKTNIEVDVVAKYVERLGASRKQ